MSGFFDYPGTTRTSVGGPVESAFWATRSQRDWQKLLAVTQTRRARAGEVALHAGDTAEAAYLVGFGRFGDDITVWEEGQALGLAAFFAAQPVAHDVVAHTDGELIRIGRSGLETLGAREPELARDVLLELGRILAIT